MTCRRWLSENGYEDVLGKIDLAIQRIQVKGSRQRRNWWDILSGDAAGNPRVREGIEFPVLRVAQIRQGKPVTPGALFRNDREQPPPSGLPLDGGTNIYRSQRRRRCPLDDRVPRINGSPSSTHSSSGKDSAPLPRSGPSAGSLLGAPPGRCTATWALVRPTFGVSSPRL